MSEYIWEEVPVDYVVRKALWEFANRTDYDPENVEKLNALKEAAFSFRCDVQRADRGRPPESGLNQTPYRENELAEGEQP